MIPIAPYTNDELLLLISEGNKEAFRYLYDNYRNKIFSIALKFTGEKQASEDVVQEMFIKLWTHRENLSAIRNFDAYLNSMVRNHIFNYLRKIAHEQAMVRKMAIVQNEQHHPEGFDSIYYKELYSLVNKAVNQLSPQQQKVYNYSRKEGLKHHEIAEAMGISPSTVKGHIVEALKHIKKAISADQEIDAIIIFFILFICRFPAL
ncbi:MAG: RNA polymerase sigma-70 factor [Bacteroidota bacterium]|nr:RNA polymerase sigma-70 factor [Bacteroidota bacterium]